MPTMGMYGTLKIIPPISHERVEGGELFSVVKLDSLTSSNNSLSKLDDNFSILGKNSLSNWSKGGFVMGGFT